MLLQERVATRPSRPESPPGATRRLTEAVARHRILLAITAIGAAVRFSTLTAQSYWLDEAQAAHETTLSFAHMLTAWSSAEWNPPLYLLIAWPWAHVFGSGEAGLRSLSALLGTLLIPVLYLCGAELVSRRAGWVAALLAALSPFMVWYSQEAREYMLLTLLCAASLLFYARACRTERRCDLAWWAVFSALALLAQYFAGFLVLAEGLVLIARLRSRSSVAALALQAVVLIPFVPHVIPQLHKQASFITEQSLLVRIEQVPVWFTVNTLYKSPLEQWGLVGAGLSAAVVIGLLLVAGSDRALRGATLAAIPAAAVLLLPLGLALVGHDDYIGRGLMPAWPALAVVFAAACTAERARVVGIALAVVLLGVFVWSGIVIDSDQIYQRPDWRAVAAALGPIHGSAPERGIAVYPGQFGTGPLSFYLHGTPWDGPGSARHIDTGPATIDEIDIVANAGQPLDLHVPGIHLIARPRDVGPYLVARFSLPGRLVVGSPTVVGEANRLLSLSQAVPAVMFQKRGG